MPGTLHIVATPIGNLEDITFRAVRVLGDVAVIAAEDTRRTAILLRHYGIETALVSFHEHNAHARLPTLLARLEAGEDVALVSDAGTPAICDPGTELVARCHEAGIRVVPVPGPSAVIAAASASGFPLVPFTFLGFAPYRSKDQSNWVRRIEEIPHTVVFFETPHRIHSLLQKCAELLGERQILLARELTKVHEHVVSLTTTELSKDGAPERGEYTVVIGPATTAAARSSDAEVIADFGLVTGSGEFSSTRQAAAALARKHGRPTQEVYDLVLQHRRKTDEG